MDAQDADRLEPKGKWYGCNVDFSLHKVSESTGEQAEPKHSMSSLRNVETPTVRPKHRARQSQESPMDDGSRMVQKAKASR